MTSVMKRKTVIRNTATEISKQEDLLDNELKAWIQSKKTMKMSELKAESKYLLMKYSSSLAPYERDAIMASMSVDIPSEYGVIFKGSYVSDNLDQAISDAINGVISSKSMRDAGTGAHAVLARRISSSISTILTAMANNTIDKTVSYYEKGGTRDVYHNGETTSHDIKSTSGGHWERVVDPGACEWCKDPERNAFERHSGCRCGRVKIGGK